MIPALLWRCPICVTNDALTHRRLPLLQETVQCHTCSTVWHVRRVPGHDYYLRVVAGPDDWLDRERSLAEWYDHMREPDILVPVQDATMPLADEEVLYLKSGPVQMAAEHDDAEFFPQDGGEEQEQSAADKRQVSWRMVGKGQLFLTSRRLVWRRAGSQHDFSLLNLASVYCAFGHGLSLLYNTRLYCVQFKAESVLKWLTYLGHLAQQIETETGHRITVSDY